MSHRMTELLLRKLLKTVKLATSVIIYMWKTTISICILLGKSIRKEHTLRVKNMTKVLNFANSRQICQTAITTNRSLTQLETGFSHLKMMDLLT